LPPTRLSPRFFTSSCPWDASGRPRSNLITDMPCRHAQAVPRRPGHGRSLKWPIISTTSGGRCMVMRLVRDDEMAEKMHTQVEDDVPPTEDEDGPVQELAEDVAAGGEADEEQIDRWALEAGLFAAELPMRAG